MGCNTSNEKYSSMYGFRFSYNTKDIVRYRYIVYRDVQFVKKIRYRDGRQISNEVSYPFVVNDMHTGKFLFTDEYNIPILCTSLLREDKHIITTDDSEIIESFNNYLIVRNTPTVICSGFSLLAESE